MQIFARKYNIKMTLINLYFSLVSAHEVADVNLAQLIQCDCGCGDVTAEVGSNVCKLWSLLE